MPHIGFVPQPPVLQSETMAKGEVYNFLIDGMKGAGWDDIASNAAVEGNVMHSYAYGSRYGAKDIYAQIRQTSIAAPATAPTAATDWMRGTASGIGVRLLPDYQPGEGGASGATSKPYNFIVGNMFKAAMDVSVEGVRVFYYFSNDLVIFYVRPPELLNRASYVGGLLAFGLPMDEIGDRDPERDLFCVLTTASTVTGSQSASTVNLVDNPVGAATATAILNEATYINHPPAPIDYKNRYMPSMVLYGNAAYGARGILPGIFVFSAAVVGNIVDGDILIEEETGYSYKAFDMTGLAVASLGSTSLIACSRVG